VILPNRIRYDLVAILPDGDTMSLSGLPPRPRTGLERLFDVPPRTSAVEGLQWEEQPKELSVRLQARLFNAPTSRGSLHQVLALGGKVVLFADWGFGAQEVFRGTIVTSALSDGGAQTIDLTCYDDLFFLTRSEDQYLFPADVPAVDILRQMFQDWGIPTGALEGPLAKMPKLVLRGSLADSIFTVLTQAFYAEGQEYVVRARNGLAEVVRPGQNAPVYHFTAGENVEGFGDEQSIADLVTEIRVIGEEAESLADDGGAAARPALDGVLVTDDPQWSRYRLRALVMGQENDSPADIHDKAQAIIDERGAPKRTRQIVVPDLPFTRRGDLVKVTAGTMDEYAVVTGVQHNADARTMQLVFDSSGTFKHRQKKVAKEKAALLADDPA
jgi:hypothetical protein